MASYEKLIQIETKPKPLKQSKLMLERGCDNCPAKRGWKHGFKPIMGKVKGKKLFIIAQNPGKKENDKRRELVGATGKLLWKELARVGVKREDCDVQNAVRCLTYEKDSMGYRIPRTPNKDEIRCCSTHTESFLSQSKAKAYLILGQIAAKQVLGREYTKNKKIFWSDNLKAKVIVTTHPAFFLRGGSKAVFKEFQNALAVAASEAFGKKVEAPEGLENFQTLLKQKYIKIQSYSEAKRAYKYLKKYFKRKRRLAADFEWDKIDGKKIGLVYGFSPTPGLTYVFILDHPANKGNKDLKKVKKIAKRLLTDQKIKLTFHHGCSDVPATKEIYGWTIRGYEYDSELGAYFHDSSVKKYGLTALAERWFPEFSGYKEVTMPEAMALGGDYKKGRKLGQLHYSNVPLNKLVLYNGADCDLSKRIELLAQGSVPQPLMMVYKDASFTVDRMQPNGPKLDYKYHGLLTKIFPVRTLALKKKLQKLSGHKNLNPNSSPQLLPIIYDEMKFEPIKAFIRGKEVEVVNCRATTLELMNEEQPDRFLTNLLEYKWNRSIETKGLKSFKNSADLHDGRLRTTWWLTGTITYRLRSGGSRGGDEEKERGIINLQNIPKNKMVKNLIISDENWYDVQEDWNDRLFEPFKKKYDKWRLLFEINEKKKERTERAQAMVVLFHKFNKGLFSYKEFLDLYTFLAFDFSQMEVRVLAQMSEDPKLIEFFEKGVDIHSAIGAELTGWTVERIKNDADTRAACKSIIFAIIYGKQHRGLYQQLINEGVKITFERVGELLAAFWKKFKRVKQLMDHFKEMGERKGYVETLFGSRRPIGNDDRNTFSENQSVNSPIQGTAHQISVIAMSLLEREKNKFKRLQDLKMEVHDQLIFGAKVKYLPESNSLGVKLLTSDVIDTIKSDFGIRWKVPLKVDGEAGFRLGTMVKLGKEVDLKYWMTEWALISEARNRDVRKELKQVEKYAA
jgi:uracil-DNA glycosylase family 4